MLLRKHLAKKLSVQLFLEVPETFFSSCWPDGSNMEITLGVGRGVKVPG